MNIENIKEEFKKFLEESNLVYVICNSDEEVLTAKNSKYFFTDNLNLAYTFKSEKEAIEFEDKHSNSIDGLTYIYTLKNNKLTKI